MDKTLIAQCCDYLSLDELHEKEKSIKTEYYEIKDKFLVFTRKVIDNLGNESIYEEISNEEKVLNDLYIKNIESSIIIYETLKQKYLNVNQEKSDYYLDLVDKFEKIIAKELSKIKK